MVDLARPRHLSAAVDRGDDRVSAQPGRRRASKRRGIHRAARRRAHVSRAWSSVSASSRLALTPLVGGQVQELREDWPDIRQDVEDFVNEKADESELNDWPIKIPQYDKLIDDLSPPERDFRGQIDRLREVGGTVLHVGLIIVLSPIIAFYLLIDLPHTAKVIQSLIPPGIRDEVNLVGRKLGHALGGYFRGQLAVALVVGIMCSIGLSIIGLKFSRSSSA